MISEDALIGMAAGAILWLFGWWRERRRTLGRVPIVSPFLIQLTGLVILLAFTADFIAAYTGISWSSPFRR